MKFETYFDALEHGAARSRILVQFLMVSTFLTFLGLYNSQPPSRNWLVSRSVSLHRAAEWVIFQADRGTRDSVRFKTPNGLTPKYLNDFPIDSFLLHANRAGLNLLGGAQGQADLIAGMPRNIHLSVPANYRAVDGTDTVIDLASITANELESALLRCNGLLCHNRSELEQELSQLHKSILENCVLIKIPLLGVSFDVNGLASLSGLAFSVLYFLLYYSMARELKNIKLLFNIHHEHGIDSRSVYQALSMFQVLTIPLSIDEFISPKNIRVATAVADLRRQSRRLSRLVPMLPMFFPLLAWLTVFTFDLDTKDVGDATNKALTQFDTWVSVVIGVVTVYAWYRCYAMWTEITATWDDKAHRVVDELAKA